MVPSKLSTKMFEYLWRCIDPTERDALGGDGASDDVKAAAIEKYIGLEDAELDDGTDDGRVAKSDDPEAQEVDGVAITEAKERVTQEVGTLVGGVVETAKPEQVGLDEPAGERGEVPNAHTKTRKLLDYIDGSFSIEQFLEKVMMIDREVASSDGTDSSDEIHKPSLEFMLNLALDLARECIDKFATIDSTRTKVTKEAAREFFSDSEELESYIDSKEQKDVWIACGVLLCTEWSDNLSDFGKINDIYSKLEQHTESTFKAGEVAERDRRALREIPLPTTTNTSTGNNDENAPPSYM